MRTLSPGAISSASRTALLMGSTKHPRVVSGKTLVDQALPPTRTFTRTLPKPGVSPSVRASISSLIASGTLTKNQDARAGHSQSSASKT